MMTSLKSKYFKPQENHILKWNTTTTVWTLEKYIFKLWQIIRQNDIFLAHLCELISFLPQISQWKRVAFDYML